MTPLGSIRHNEAEGDDSRRVHLWLDEATGRILADDDRHDTGEGEATYYLAVRRAATAWSGPWDFRRDEDAARQEGRR
jgi:hypothetical protein